MTLAEIIAKELELYFLAMDTEDYQSYLLTLQENDVIDEINNILTDVAKALYDCSNAIHTINKIIEEHDDLELK